MKSLIFVFALLFVAAFADFRKTQITSVTTDGTDKCKRALQKVVTADEIKIFSGRKCTKDNTNTASALFFDINTRGRPDIRVAFFRRQKDQDNVNAAAVSFRIFFERIIEYRELNNVTGYQPLGVGGDRPNLIDFLAAKNWNAITESVTTGPNGAELHEFYVSTLDGEFAFTWHFTTDFVEGTNKTRFVPHSAKFSFAVNHVYQDANADGLALRFFIVSRGALRNKTKTDTTTGLDLTRQTAVSIDYDGPSNSYFSFDDFVTATDGTQLNVFKHFNDVDVDRADANAHFNLDADRTLKVSTIWVSVPRTAGAASTAFSWDPYFGIVDDNANSASTMVVSLLLALLVALLI